MTTSLRDPINLRDLLGAERPIDRLDVLLDLLDARGAGDDAGHLRARRQPGECQFEHAVAARLREGLQLLDDILVAWRNITVAQRGRLAEPRILGRRSAALVFAGEQTAGERKERQQPEIELPRRRQQILLDVAHHQAVLVLAGDERVTLIARATYSASAMRQAGKFELPM
jgi:hypothetical protein